MDALKLNHFIFIESIGKSIEYLLLSYFVALESCNSSMARRLVENNAKEAKIAFRFLRRKINRRMQEIISGTEKMRFYRTVRRELPALPRGFRL